MQRTLIAVFDNRGAAESALEELLAAGFSREKMRLGEGAPTGAPTGAGAARASGTSGGLVDSFRNFIGNIFGTDESEHLQRVSDAVTRGHRVLTLVAANEDEVGRASAIVERCGALDIDVRAAGWNGGALASEAMRKGPGAQQRAAPMSQQSGQGSAQGSVQGTAEQGAGGRAFDHMAEPSVQVPAEAIEAQELYFRSHYNSNYAGGDDSYDAYAPAYQYGAEMAERESYRGRPWNDVEPHLRSDWEGRNPGSAWDKFRAAVRHGWERVTHQGRAAP